MSFFDFQNLAQPQWPNGYALNFENVCHAVNMVSLYF